uniref:NADH-ubiquinone oxidoreductase chain 4 n=1 Tax=Calanus hyperboreus TaxID=114069 RepID=K7QK62_CALHY|nr:NADH dehydrogenase subunit 4 [Calanus hyperboreus]AFU88793.1 NADH dehydrogenase subunit 4 [Calanus hyperboreus]
MMKILIISTLMIMAPVSIQLPLLSSMMIFALFPLNMSNMFNMISMLNYDMISISLMIMTLWITILMKFSQFNSFMMNSLFSLFLILNLSLVCSFSSNSVLMFYFFFEWSLLPIFMIIMGWGYQMERLKASLYLLFYTLFASLPLLLVILLIMNNSFSSSMFYLTFLNNFFMNNQLITLMTITAFLVKFPMFFVHQWLPKAHVEAPVAGSMILAGVLLKLGGYGLLRLGVLFGSSDLLVKVMVFSLLGGGLLGVVCLSHSDMKVMIAYSSVVHMALIIVGVLSFSSWGINGAMMVMIAHGVCSSGMFSCANMMYERAHSRSIMCNKGILNFFPGMSIMWFMLCMANFGGPFTYNLLGEILLIVNLSTLTALLLSSVILISFFSAAYSLVLYSSTQQGAMFNYSYSLSNMCFRELLVLFSHVWPLIIISVSPMLI